jgi:peptidyl-prolyl cis-trans isomerase SurA
MKKNLFMITILLIFTVIINFIGCSNPKKMTVAEIGDEKITLFDFEKQYLKTVGSVDSAKVKTMEEKKEFLNLLIKFHLKVKDGKEKGYLEVPDIKTEITDFKKKYIPEYLVDKKVVESAIKNTYERKRYDMRTSFIMVNMQLNNPEDSIRAYKKIDSIYAELKSGKDFLEVAAKFTEDQGFNTNKGDTYYLTAGMIPPEYENAIYDLKVGDYSKEPVKISTALYIPKLTDKVKRSAGIRVSHIMIQDKRDSLNQLLDTLASFEKIKEIKSKVNKDNFSQMAMELSDDPGSKQKGGDIGLIDNRRRLPQDIDSAVFSLKVGEISEPIKSQFGWHIFTVTEIKDFESFEKQREQLKGEYKKGILYKPARMNYIAEILKQYDFKADSASVLFVKSKLTDSTLTIGQYNFDSLFAGEENQKVMATYSKGVIKLDDVVQYLSINKDLAGNAPLYSTIIKIFEGAAENPILNLEADKAGIEKDEEFSELLSEYENGLVSFRIDQEELFSKIKISNDDMLNYYESNKNNYSITDSTGTHPKIFEEVKAEISNNLQQLKFKEMEANYIEELKKKYTVKINEDVLAKSFTIN